MRSTRPAGACCGSTSTSSPRNSLVLCHSLIVGYIGSQVIVSFDEIARETLLFSLDKALGGSMDTQRSDHVITNTDVYATDFYAWCMTTAQLVRAGQWDALDPEALA